MHRHARCYNTTYSKITIFKLRAFAFLYEAVYKAGRAYPDGGTRFKLLICQMPLFGSYHCLCSFNRCTLATWHPPVSHTQSVTSRVGVICRTTVKVGAKNTRSSNTACMNEEMCIARLDFSRLINSTGGGIYSH